MWIMVAYFSLYRNSIELSFQNRYIKQFYKTINILQCISMDEWFIMLIVNLDDELELMG
jgi:hypothetical protein